MSALTNTPSHFTSRLVRNHDMVHRRLCVRVSGVMVNPWLWAESRSNDEIAEAAQNGLKFCRACDPLDLKSADSEGRSNGD